MSWYWGVKCPVRISEKSIGPCSKNRLLYAMIDKAGSNDMPRYRRLCLAKLEILAICDRFEMLSSLSRSLEGISTPDANPVIALVMALDAFPTGHSAVCCCRTGCENMQYGSSDIEFMLFIHSASHHCGYRRVTQLIYASSQAFRV